MTLQSFIYTCFYGQDLLHTFYDHILHILVQSDTWYMCNPESFYMKKKYFVSFFIAKKYKPAKLCSRFRYQTCDTGKSVSEALILKSVNPQYDDRLFIEVQYKKNTCSEHVVYKNCFECQNKNKKQCLYTTCSELGIFLY